MGAATPPLDSEIVKGVVSSRSSTASAGPAGAAAPVRSFMRVRTEQEKPAREDDFGAWLLYQANELRIRKPEFIDWEQLAEELDEMYANLEVDLSSDVLRIVEHLIKLVCEPSENEWRGRSRKWKAHTDEHRARVTKILKLSKRLRVKLDAIIAEAYPTAVRIVANKC